jgi:AcrR family transcriptional regulator
MATRRVGIQQAKGAARAPDTKTRILDSAEKLFAVHGYDGVSVRNITDSAGVRLGLLAYHFRSKEELFAAVVGRRIDVLNGRRIENLSRLLATPPLTVRGILEAFIVPYLELTTQGDEGWRSYTLLIAQISHNEMHAPLLKHHLDPVARRYLDALASCFPKTPREIVVSSFVFTLAAMVGVFARSSRFQSLSDGTLSSELDTLCPSLIEFAVAGITGLCTASALPARGTKKAPAARRTTLPN